jgi:hypothetical protein
MPDQPEWRTSRCEDCGDQIEIDPDGMRTLCSCDATE